MPSLILPPAPDKPERLRSFALGPQLHTWSDAFQPELLGTATAAMQAVRDLVEAAVERLATLTSTRGCGLYTLEEEHAEEMRLTLLLERQVAMLDRLGAFHARTTSVSAAALLHAMTRGRLASDPERIERNATPRRSLGSASDMVASDG
jgi:hypothetical protein